MAIIRFASGVKDNILTQIKNAIDAVDTAALTFKRGFTGLELVSSTGVVSKLKLTDTPDTEPDPVRVFGEATT